MNFEITPLFATPIYHSYSNISNLQNELDVANNLEFKNAKANKVSKDTYVLDLIELHNYKKICDDHLKNFVNNVVDCQQEFYITNSWIAVTNPGECHYTHHHPNSIISGVLYLQSDNKSGKINFHCKSTFKNSFAFNYDFKQHNVFNSDMWSYSPKSGEILIFPSWVNHSVDVNLSESPRIILGFNTFVKGTFGSNEYSADLIL